VNWEVITASVLISPLTLLWGWSKYFRISGRSDWRSRASLVGLASPLLSVALWAFALLLARGMAWDTSYPAIQRLITIGVWIPVIGTTIGLAGRPLLLLAIVPGSLGTVLFWYATTVP
jgi:hypothetical protein